MFISRKTIFIITMVIVVVAAVGFLFYLQHAQPPRYRELGTLPAYNPDYWSVSNVTKGDLVLLNIQVNVTDCIWQSRLYYSNLTEIQTINDDGTHIYEFHADATGDYLLRLYDEHGLNYTVECTHPITEQPTMVLFSIDRLVLKKGENATLTVIIENFDLETHVVEYRFNASHRVLIYKGAEKLLPRIGSQYTFNYILDATVPHTYIYTYTETRVFIVSATLEEGVSSATYPISLTVYFDGEELEKTWNDLILKVEE